MQITAPMRRHPGRTAAIAVVLLAIGSFALYWFAPWNLFLDKRVDEALPGASAPAGGAEAGEDQTSPGGIDSGGDASPVTLAEGGFASLEHETAGTALVVELEDGTRFLRLEELETSNGPDLRVYLSSIPAQDDWYVYDDDVFVDLGGLKGNLGSSNYLIPAGTDLSDFRSAVIWCRRFSVGFGVAPLDVAA